MTAPETAKKQWFHFSNIGAILVLYYVLGLVLYYATWVLSGLLPFDIPSAWRNFIYDDLPQLVLVLPYCALLLRLNTFATPQRRKLGAKNFWMCIPISVTLLYFGNAVGQYVNAFITASRGKAPENHLETVIEQSDPVVILIFVVILAPILEELLFRKFLVDAVYPYGELPAILISGIAFGAFHGNFYQFFYAALLGCFFAFIYCRTGRIRYTIILHALVNFNGSLATSALSAIIGLDVSGPDATLYKLLSIATYLCYSFLILALFILGVILIIKKVRHLRFAKGVTKLRRPLVTILLNPGMLLCLGLCIYNFMINL